MSDSDAEKIGLALRNNMSLNCLDLSYNCFGEIGGQFLATGLVSVSCVSIIILSEKGIYKGDMR